MTCTLPLILPLTLPCPCPCPCTSHWSSLCCLLTRVLQPVPAQAGHYCGRHCGRILGQCKHTGVGMCLHSEGLCACWCVHVHVNVVILPFLHLLPPFFLPFPSSPLPPSLSLLPSPSSPLPPPLSLQLTFVFIPYNGQSNCESTSPYGYLYSSILSIIIALVSTSSHVTCDLEGSILTHTHITRPPPSSYPTPVLSHTSCIVLFSFCI